MNVFPLLTVAPKIGGFGNRPSDQAVGQAPADSGAPILYTEFTFDPRDFPHTIANAPDADRLAIWEFYKRNKDLPFWWYNYQDEYYHQVIFVTPPDMRLQDDDDKSLWAIRIHVRQIATERYSTVPPVLHLRMNDRHASTKIVNSAQFGEHATAQRNASLLRAAGKLGNRRAMAFNGTTDYVTCGNGASINFGTSDLSGCAWIKTSYTGSQQRILCKRTGNDGYDFLIETNGDLGLLIGDGVVSGATTYTYRTWTPSSSLRDGSWHFVGFVANRDGDSFLIADGTLSSALSFTDHQGSVDVAANLFIGRYGPSAVGYFNGSLSNVMLFNVALTEGEIGNLYRNGAMQFASSCVGRWLLDENAASTTVDDLSGNGNTGTAQRNTNLTSDESGPTGRCICFNGTSDYLTVEDHASINFGTGDFSIAFWLCSARAAGTEEDILAKRTATKGFVMNISGTTSDFLFGISDGAGWLVPSINTTMQDKEWKHCVITVDRSDSMYLYLNGVQAGPFSMFTGAGASGIIDVSDSLVIGKSPLASSFYFHGAMDDVRLYNIALTAAQVASLYNSGNGTED